MGDLGFSRFIGLISGFFGQWLADWIARPLAVVFAFMTIAVVGMWVGSTLAHLVDQDLLLNVAVGALYLVTGAAFWRLLRTRKGS